MPTRKRREASELVIVQTPLGDDINLALGTEYTRLTPAQARNLAEKLIQAVGKNAPKPTRKLADVSSIPRWTKKGEGRYSAPIGGGRTAEMHHSSKFVWDAYVDGKLIGSATNRTDCAEIIENEITQ